MEENNNVVIAIVNEKGGTGKTTTAVNLSAALGELNQKVLLVDLDGQAASSRWLGVEEDNRLAEAMCRGKGLSPIPDVLPNVSLAPASGKLDSISHDLRPTQGGQLRKVISEMTGYDFILIDCPPSLGNRLIGNALLAATHVVVPVETSILALDGLKILLTTLQDVRDGFGHQLILGGVIACRYDPRTRLSRLVLDELCRALPGKVFQTVIRENVRIRECPASGQSILAFAGESHAAEDYRALAAEMIQNPAMWREPVSAESQQQSESLVGGLRDSAAAAVRQSARKPFRQKPDEESDQIAQDAPYDAIEAGPIADPLPRDTQEYQEAEEAVEAISGDAARIEQSPPADVSPVQPASGRREFEQFLAGLSEAERQTPRSRRPRLSWGLTMRRPQTTSPSREPAR